MIMKDFLNDRLQTSLLQRIRYAMKPDEAYGLIFSWENVLVGYVIIYLNKDNASNFSNQIYFYMNRII